MKKLKFLLITLLVFSSQSHARGIPVIDKTHIVKQLVEFVEQLNRWKETVSHRNNHYAGAGMGGGLIPSQKTFDGIPLVNSPEVSVMLKNPVIGKYIQQINKEYGFDENVLASSNAPNAIKRINDARASFVQLQQLKDKAKYRMGRLESTQSAISHAETEKDRQGMSIRSNAEIGYTNVALMQTIIANAEQRAKENLLEAQRLSNHLREIKNNKAFFDKTKSEVARERKRIEGN